MMQVKSTLILQLVNAPQQQPEAIVFFSWQQYFLFLEHQSRFVEFHEHSNVWVYWENKTFNIYKDLQC